MSKSHSTPPVPPGQPERPPGAVLFWHQSGRWCKKINGRFFYFGRGSYEDALKEYNRQKNDLHAGRLMHEPPEEWTVYLVCGKFLSSKLAKRDTGELAARTFRDYEGICRLLIEQFGKHRPVSDLKPHDFGRLRIWMAERWGPVRVANEVQRVRGVFKWAYETRLVKQEVWFGPDFKRPNRKTLRVERNKKGPKLFTAAELIRLVDAAPPLLHGTPPALKAMILLGINCGFGNHDVEALPLSALDLDAGWVNYPRPKTGIPRRCPLWPETVQAIREALARRPKPRAPENAGLAFITRVGGRWAKDVAASPLSREFAILLLRVGVTARKGIAFYALRHVFRTVADEAKDQPAVDLIMGHARDNYIGSHYVETISDARLQAVVNHVHSWLFAEAPAEGEDDGREPVVLRIERA
jgi:integrase